MKKGTAGTKVLVIDDDVTQRLLVKEYLEGAGYVVRLADDGPKGLVLAGSTQPQIILLDFMLPSLDGGTVCRRLKESPATAHIPILLITGSRDKDVIERGLAAGAVDFVTKPVDWEFLADRVEHVLRKDEDGGRKPEGRRAGVPAARAPVGPAVPTAREQELSKALETATARVDELSKQLGEAERMQEETASAIADVTARLEAAEREAGNASEQSRQAAAAVWGLVAAAAKQQLEAIETLQRRVAFAQSLDGEGDVRSGLAQIGQMAGALAATEANLRLLALVSAGGQPARVEAVDLGRLVGEVADLCGGVGQRPDVTISTNCPSAVWIEADARKLRTALVGLAENAIKFSPPNGSIEIRAEVEADGCIAVGVTDHGFGIPPARLAQLRGGIGQRVPGDGKLGLGIPTARAIAEQHGGSIDIESENTVGTAVTIRLPATCRAAAPRERAHNALQQRLAQADRTIAAVAR